MLLLLGKFNDLSNIIRMLSIEWLLRISNLFRKYVSKSVKKLCNSMQNVPVEPFNGFSFK